MAEKKVPKNIKFAEALAELEEQVHLLEQGDLPLEEAIDVYKYAVELSKVCNSKLETVKQEVEKIVPSNNADGTGYTTEKFPDMEA